MGIKHLYFHSGSKVLFVLLFCYAYVTLASAGIYGHQQSL